MAVKTHSTIPDYFKDASAELSLVEVKQFYTNLGKLAEYFVSIVRRYAGMN